MNIQSIDRATEGASGIVMLGMGGVRVAELGEDAYRWINKIDKEVPFKIQAPSKLVRGLSSVALVSALWYGYRAASHLYQGTSEDEVNDWLRVASAGLSVANLAVWTFFPLRNLGACPLFFRHATFFGGVVLDAVGLGHAAHQGASLEELAMQLGMLLVFNTGREDRAIYGQYVLKFSGMVRQAHHVPRGELIYLDDYRPKPSDDFDPDPQAHEAALLMAAGAESVPLPDIIGSRLRMIEGGRTPVKGLDFFASGTGDDDAGTNLILGQVRDTRRLSPASSRNPGSTTSPAPLDPSWKIFAYPRLAKALPAILTHPETVHATTSIPRDRLRLVAGLRDWITNDVLVKWGKDCRPLSHPEQAEIMHALESRLQATARVDPRFIRFFQKLYDGDYRQDSVNASPYMIGTPLDSALTHLWGLLISAARWGRGGAMTGEDIDFFRAVPRESVRKPVINNGEEDPHFYILESPGYDETAGGIDRSLWYRGKYRLTEGRDFEELYGTFKEPGKYSGAMRLATAGYKRTPWGYVIELVQGDPNLRDVSVDTEGRGFKPLMKVLAHHFEHHTTWIARSLLDDLRRSDPTHSIYFRFPIYMDCIDYRLLAQKPPTQYSRYRDIGHALRQLPPTQIRKMIQAKEKELKGEWNRLMARMPENPVTARDIKKYLRVIELEEPLGYLSKIEGTWKKLTRIANNLGFKLEDSNSSVMVLRV